MTERRAKKSAKTSAQISIAEIAARCLAAKLKKITSGKPVTFPHVTPAAQALVAALAASAVVRARTRRTWIVCSGTRDQETLFTDLAHWSPDAMLLPEQELAAAANALPDPEVEAERLSTLDRLADANDTAPVVLTESALDTFVPAREALGAVKLGLRRGTDSDRDDLLARLDAAGFDRQPTVSSRGQFAVRGGILDVFSWQHPLPVRIEFADETVASIREFDLDTQISVRELDSCVLFLGDPAGQSAPLREWIAPEDCVLAVDCTSEPAAVQILAGAETDEDAADYSGAFFDPGFDAFEAGDFVVDETKRSRLMSQLKAWCSEGWTIRFHCANAGESDRLRGLLAESGFDTASAHFELGQLTRSFTCPDAKLAFIADAEIFGRYRGTGSQRIRHARAARKVSGTPLDFGEITDGDLVVHLQHGIARYLGIRDQGIPGLGDEECMELEFAEGAKLYVPLAAAYLVSRYVGVGKISPPLSTLGDARWGKARANAEKAVRDYAAKLLSVQAERATLDGHAFKPDTRWQEEFEGAFIFRETPDQLRAIADTKTDMESPRPMERLICGDVGFGKTEVAIRAAFKAVMGQKQVAVLVPTTVLAQQHYQTFRERMSDYPIRVEVLSRFRSQANQKAVARGLEEGSVDIVIGTHRLLSGDIRFKNLGLLVVDEEQRFGVVQKERVKNQHPLVDVLTLSATPIPRTLYLSLMGARDLSTLETPPANRLPVETAICPYDERIIREALRRELRRQGQIYYLHNRIEGIERVRERLLHLCPDARIAIGHGQMAEGELEEVMREFIAGKTDVLVSTTIIESGLDIPNANTIIIDRADRFGLADLYQLRGRVGRSGHKAYAYLLLPREMLTRDEARKRVEAIKQHASLGAGFRIAMRDLEIRGAGNLLGTAQSGHIAAVGFDLYCQLLKQAVARLQGKKLPRRADVPLDFDFVVTRETAWEESRKADLLPAFLPTGYIREPRLRIEAYRSAAGAENVTRLTDLAREWRDRFGPQPEAARNLLSLAEIRIRAAEKRINRVETRDGKLMITRHGELLLIEGRFPRLTPHDPARNVREITDLVRTL